MLGFTFDLHFRWGGPHRRVNGAGRDGQLSFGCSSLLSTRFAAASPASVVAACVRHGHSWPSDSHTFTVIGWWTRERKRVTTPPPRRAQRTPRGGTSPHRSAQTSSRTAPHRR